MTPSNMGPKPLFEEVQVHRALELIGEHQPIGRKKLAEKLGVGEGSIRTILDRLKEKGFVSSTNQGHVLTERGEEEVEGEARSFLELTVGDLTVGEVDVATLVENASEEVNLGIEERDEAIKVGAKGATILIFEDEDLKLPDSEAELGEEVKKKLINFFQPSEKDVIIIGTADNKKDAERGALAAAEYLSNRVE